MALILDIRARSQKANQTIKNSVRQAEGDIKRLEKNSVTSATKINSAFSGLGKTLAAGFGIGGAFAIFEGFKKAVSAASDLEEATNKNIVTFGRFSNTIQEFAKASDDAFGISQQKALEYTATLGVILQTSGLAADATADMSVELVKLAADMASFNNIPIDVALQKIRSGLVGETEPLRTVGVLLDEATVKTKALELGLASSAKEVDQAAKVQARYALILEQTTKQQGDFERTSDSLANATRRLQARFDTILASIGDNFIPVLERLLDVSNRLVAEDGGLTKMIRRGQDLGELFLKINPLAKLFVESISGEETGGASPFSQFAQGMAQVNEQLETSIETFERLARVGPPDTGQVPLSEEVIPDNERVLDLLTEEELRMRGILAAQRELVENGGQFADVIGEVPPFLDSVNDNLEITRSLTESFTQSLANAVLQGRNLDQVFQQLAIRSALSFLPGGSFFSQLAGSGGIFAQNGLDFTVPSGFPNDSFRMPLNVSSGERVQVTPANQTTNINRNVGAISLNFPNVATFDKFTLQTEILPRIKEVLEEGGQLGATGRLLDA